MNKQTLLVLLMFGLMLNGCAGKSYEEKLAERPFPTSQKGIESECAWIRNEIVRQNTASAMGATTQYALVYQALAQKNIAALESRASNLRCGAAFSTTHIIEKPATSSSINDCIKACKENTTRTSEQCFDACNK